MDFFRRRVFGAADHQYALVGQPDARTTTPTQWTKKHSLLMVTLIAFSGIVTFLVTSSYASAHRCDGTTHGYQCKPEISHYWGQYAPYFSVPSEIQDTIPEAGGCHITFAQVLSRHGARDPTLTRGILYAATFAKIKANVREFKGKYAFLADYEYYFGADQLTTFGQQQMYDSGVQFYRRYELLNRELVPFVRASGQKRVVDSAKNWTQGFQDAKASDPDAGHGGAAYPGVDVVISERPGANNTLHHDLCVEFESGSASTVAEEAELEWAHVFAKDIQARINADLPGADLSIEEIVYLMDFCPFDTVASPVGKISPFCNLFTEDEWHQYGYFETLDKWYGYSYGNPLGPTQGVGFVNELIARMTNEAVEDNTSTNSTLDSSPTTFPLGRQLYADFSHDNDIVAALSACGFYDLPAQLPNTTLVEAPDAGGFSTSWTVPFAARVYFEKMKCADHDEELVRVVVNDRVLPLSQCEGDVFGRCTLTAFTESLHFARSGGHWDQCFK